MRRANGRSGGRQVEPGRGRALAARLGLLALLGAGGCAPRPPLGRLPGGLAPRDLNLLLVTLDTTRADRIGAWARPLGRAAPETPHLDALAARGARFERAVAVTPLTLPAHCTMMTGLLPAAHGVRDNGGYRLDAARRTLAELFADAGARTGGFVSAFVLDHKWGIAQGFDTYFDDFDRAEAKSLSMGEIQRRGDETVARAAAWLDEVGGARFFAWVHLYDPHTPYEPPEPYRGRHPRAPYNAEIAWTDHLVGELVDHLERRGLSDRTLVAVVGDHGESLGEHDETGHGYFLYQPSTHVPLLVAGPYPALAGRTVAEVVGQADLAPTLAELAGLAPAGPAGLEPGQGRSLVPLLAGRPDPPGPPRGYSETFVARLHYGWAELRGLRDGRWQFFEAPRPELYDLEADPGETVNLAERDRRRVAEMRAALAAIDAGVRPPATPSKPVLEDEETLRALAALGYVGGQSVDASKSFRELADPKDRLATYNQLNRARELARGEKPGEAIPLLEQVLAADPAVVDAWFTLGNVCFRRRDWECAERNYRETLARRADHDWAMIGLADTFVARGRVDDAVVGYRRHLESDPANAQIRYRLAQVLLDAGRDAEAEAAFRETLATEPRTARAEVGLAVVEFRRRAFGAAHAALDRAAAIDAETKWIGYNRALLLEAEGRDAEAEAAYREEARRHPDAHQAPYNLARLLERRGDAAGALAADRAAVAAEPKFGLGRLMLARGLLGAGDLAGAEREAREGLRLDPRAPYAPLGHYLLADVYSRLGRAADAEREARAGRDLESRLARAASARPAPAEGDAGR
jgi:arylsulfatase A-like enzyme/predicted Zn-dependent protease